MKLNPFMSVIIGATIGGLGGVFIKMLGLPATTITFFRLAVPVLLLSLYLSWKKTKIFRGDYKIMLFASLLNAARMFLYIIAYLYTTIANAVILLFTYPIFATIFGIFILKEKVTKKNIILLALAFSGIIFMYLNKEISMQNKDFIGMAAMLVSAILVALMFVILKKGRETYSKAETIFFQNLVGAVIFLPFIFINRPLPSPAQISVGFSYGLVVGLVGFIFLFYALKRMKMAEYSLFAYWEIVAAIVFSIIFFKEIITWNMIVGGALIIVPGLLLKISEERKK